MLAEYRRLVVVCGLRDGVGPVTPAQVLAGAPANVFVFHTAWAAAVLLLRLEPPGPNALAAMDVLVRLRAYRLAGRAEHLRLQALPRHARPPVDPPVFWTGTLRVSCSEQDVLW